MYRQQFFPRLGDYIDTLLKVTKLTKSIVCVTGGMGGSTYNLSLIHISEPTRP